MSEPAVATPPVIDDELKKTLSQIKGILGEIRNYLRDGFLELRECRRLLDELVEDRTGGE